MTSRCLPAILTAVAVSVSAASLVATPPATQPSSIQLLQNEFQDDTDNTGQWQPFTLQWTPDHKQRFLGEFTSSTGPVRLRLSALPPHTYIRIAFDLYMLKSWDGNAREAWGVRVGPDPWDLSVEGGPTLIHTTFALFTRDGGRQAFPDDFPCGDHPHRTGAIANNSLGFTFDNHPMDAIYHLDLAFPHTADTLQLAFQSPGPEQEPWDESWGLDDFCVEALTSPPGQDLDDETLEQLCARLNGPDPMAAHHATWRLIGAGDRAIPMLRKNLMPPPADRERVRDLIALLHDPRWTIREEAARALKRLGLSAVPQIREILAQPLPAETEIRLREIIAPSNADDPTHPDALRYARYVRILDVLNSPQSAELLKTIATEGPTRDIRESANAARHRILRPAPAGHPRPDVLK